MLDKITPRHLYVPKLIQCFSQDVTDIQKDLPQEPQEDFILHLIKLIKAIKSYSESSDEGILTTFTADNTALLKKHGKALSDYHNKGFHKYFQFETILVDKGIISGAEFNKLPAEEQSLTKDEINAFCRTCLNVLSMELNYFYLRQGEEKPKDQSEDIEIKVPKGSITLTRQVLTIYYFLTYGLGIKRNGHDQTTIARLIHLLLGVKLDDAVKSEIYKRYLKMPNYTSDLRQVQDLQFIRPYFEALGMIPCLDAIDKDIAQTMQELSLSDKARYKKGHP